MSLFATSLFSIGKDKDLIELLNQNQVTIIMMRHGEGMHNLKNLMYSNRSPGIYLTPRGVAQVHDASAQLAGHNVDLIYVSPVFRTMQTAHIVGMQLKIAPENMIVHDDLREQHFGIFENKTYDEYSSHFATGMDMFAGPVPEGEHGEDVSLRTKELLKEIASKHSGKTVLLVTHAFNCCHVSMLLTGEINDIPSQAKFKVYRPKS